MNYSEETPTITFELLTQEYCTTEYLNWLKDPDVNAFLELDPSSLTVDSLRDYVSNGNSSSSRINFAILLGGSHIGNCSLYTHEGDGVNTFRIGWFIGDKRFWGGHTSTTVMFMMFEIGFEVLGKELCVGSVYRSHAKARLSNKYVGFEEVGTGIFYSHRRQCDMEIVNLSLDKDRWRIRKAWLISRHTEIYGNLDSFAELFINYNPDLVRLI